jgi:hypothetical protein
MALTLEDEVMIPSPPAKNDDELPSNIYFIASGNNGPVKIGFAVNPDQRIKDLQTGNPCKLILIGRISEVYQPVVIERFLHERFSKSWIRGEWFERTAELMRLIEACRDE